MPTLSALNADTETRPVLTDIEIDRARPYGRVRQAQLGEILYRPGEVGVPCFILLSAHLEIVQPSIHGGGWSSTYAQECSPARRA